MLILGYNVSLAGATIILAIVSAVAAIFTAISACFTAKVALHTKKLAEYNKEIIEKNDELIMQNEKHHRDRYRPICVPLTTKQDYIASFDEVMGKRSTVLNNINIPENIPDETYIFSFIFVNNGLGPATNVRFHLNNIQNQRITKDFLVTHILMPGGTFGFRSEIPAGYASDALGNAATMMPWQVVNDTYFIVCEYESMFSGDVFHSVISKGYRDPFLAGDGRNSWRIHRPATPLVEFKAGLDQAQTIWSVPPDDNGYPGESLNFPPIGGRDAAN